MSKSAVANAATAHASALAARHAELESRIARETMRPMPDMSLVARLKKSKLRIKDSLLSH